MVVRNMYRSRYCDKGVLTGQPNKFGDGSAKCRKCGHYKIYHKATTVAVDNTKKSPRISDYLECLFSDEELNLCDCERYEE